MNTQILEIFQDSSKNTYIAPFRALRRPLWGISYTHAWEGVCVCVCVCVCFSCLGFWTALRVRDLILSEGALLGQEEITNQAQYNLRLPVD